MRHRPESVYCGGLEGVEAKLSFGGHALVENRHGLLVDSVPTDAQLLMLVPSDMMAMP
jgi:hypothetical protein